MAHVHPSRRITRKSKKKGIVFALKVHSAIEQKHNDPQPGVAGAAQERKIADKIKITINLIMQYAMHKDKLLQKIQNDVIIKQRQNTSAPVRSPHVTQDDLPIAIVIH